MRKSYKLKIIIILVLALSITVIRKSWFFHFSNNSQKETSISSQKLTTTNSALEKIKKAITPETNSNQPPNQLIIDVPFTPQAPFAQWDDPRQQDGCEEAAMVMAWHWINDDFLLKQEAKDEILALNNFEEKLLGESTDTSIEDIIKIFREYYQYDNIRTVYDISVQDIKDELLAGNIVLVPTDGTILKNPYYTQPGPTRHMLVIKGFNDKKNQFITNDPGTKRGEGFKYNYEVIMNAIINYSTGDHAPLLDERKVMIVVKKLETGN
jgi:uncharacterized protein YvpB